MSAVINDLEEIYSEYTRIKSRAVPIPGEPGAFRGEASKHPERRTYLLLKLLAAAATTPWLAERLGGKDRAASALHVLTTTPEIFTTNENGERIGLDAATLIDDGISFVEVEE